MGVNEHETLFNITLSRDDSG